MQRNSLLLYVIVSLCVSMVMFSSCSKEEMFNYNRLIGEWLVVSPETELGHPFQINDTVKIGVPPLYPDGCFVLISINTESDGKAYSTEYQCIIDDINHEMKLRRSGDTSRRYDILVLNKKVVIRRKGRDELIEFKRLSDNPGPIRI